MTTRMTEQIGEMNSLQKREELWRMYLKRWMTDEEYVRLCECHSREEDIIQLTLAYWEFEHEVKRNRDISVEDAFMKAWEHLSSNDEDFDYTEARRNEIIYRVTCTLQSIKKL